MTHFSRLQDAKRLLQIRELQRAQAETALAPARQRVDAARDDLSAADEAERDARAAWQAYVRSGHPAPEMLQSFGAGVVRLGEARRQAAARLDGAEADCRVQEDAVRAAILCEDQVRAVVKKIALKVSRQVDERQLQKTEDRISFDWSRR